MKKAIRYIFFALAFFTEFTAAAQYPGTFVPDNKPAYDSLQNILSTLVQKESSQEKRLETLRGKLTGTPSQEARKRYAEEILVMETIIFQTRDSLESVRRQIADIEQEWILRDIERGGTGIIHAEPEADDNPNLICNSYIKNSLSTNEWVLLWDAQDCERQLDKYLNSIKNNYITLHNLTTQYATVEKGPKADSLYADIITLDVQNKALADTLESMWSDIFETRLYLYNCALDTNNEIGAISESADQLAYLKANTDNLAGEYMYDAMTFYAIEKTFLLQYEKRIARLARLRPATDSLAKVVSPAANLRNFYLPVLDTEERLFIDYADIKTASPPKYNASNPIPLCEIPPKGVIYRVLLGSYTRLQPVSLFKGVYPLARELKADRKHYYYAGGFETYEAAAEATAQLKKLGLVNVQVVMWDNGQYNGKLDAAPQNVKGNAKAKQQPRYRIEIISPSNELGHEIRSMIESSAPGKEISRMIDPTTGKAVFTVGTFNKQAAAETLAAQIKDLEKGAEIKIITL